MKELSKFLAGFMTFLAIDHAFLFYCDELPLSYCGLIITETTNTILMIVPAVISLLLIYYGWFQK
jgi:hypothetical protein